MRAYLPILPEAQLIVQDRLVEIEQIVQAKYGMQTVVVALPKPA